MVMMRKCHAYERMFIAAIVLALPWCGCSQDARLAGKKLRDPKVGTVKHYDVVLDESAPPEAVTYVLLKAMRDDFTATTREARERALDTQFDVCAPDTIASMNRTPLSRKEFLFDVVNRWTPTVSHYLGTLDLAWPESKSRLVATIATDEKNANGKDAKVMVELPDPAGDPHASVVLVVRLVRESGYWRVVRLEYDMAHRRLATPGEMAIPDRGDSTG